MAESQPRHLVEIPSGQPSLAERLVYSHQARLTFNEALGIAETLGPKEKVNVSVHIAVNMIRAGISPGLSVINYLGETQDGLQGETDFNGLLLKREALYGSAKIDLASGYPSSALSSVSRDPYLGHPFEPFMSLDIAKALVREGRSPQAAIERAIQASGQDTYFATHPHSSETRKLADNILIARTLAEIGDDPHALLDNTRLRIAADNHLTVDNDGGPLTFTGAHAELAKAYALAGNLDVVRIIAEDDVAAHVLFSISQIRQPMGQPTSRSLEEQREKINEAIHKDQSDRKSDFFAEVALDLVENGKVEEAVELAIMSGNNLYIGEVAARGAALLAERGQDAAGLVDLATYSLLGRGVPEKNGRYYYPEAQQAKALSFAARAAQDPEPIFTQTLTLAQALKPAEAMGSYSHRSNVWTAIGRNMAARNYEATFAFETATELLMLQNGPLIAESKLGRWTEEYNRSSRGEGGGNWHVFRKALLELTQDMLNAGYVSQAEKAVQRFIEVDTEGRFFKPEDKAKFLADKALVISRQGLTTEELRATFPRGLSVVVPGDRAALEANIYFRDLAAQNLI